MTYANDCIEMRDRAKRRTLKYIKNHTDAELDRAIEVAQRRFGEDFYVMLHGIDAYLERRSRRVARAVNRRTQGLREEMKW